LSQKKKFSDLVEIIEGIGRDQDFLKGITLSFQLSGGSHLLMLQLKQQFESYECKIPVIWGHFTLTF